MKRRTVTIVVWIALFGVHAMALLLSCALASSDIWTRGDPPGPSVAANLGTALFAALGFPFLDLAQILADSETSDAWLFGSALLTSATWATTAVWISQRKWRR